MDLEEIRERLRNPPPVMDRLGECPTWCKGRPHMFNTSEPDQQAHMSEPMHKLYVATKFDHSRVLDGDRYWTLGAELEWRPFAERPEDAEIAGLVYVDGGMPVEMTPDQIRAFADSLAPQAERLREFADLLAGLRTGDMPDQGDPAKPGILVPRYGET